MDELGPWFLKILLLSFNIFLITQLASFKVLYLILFLWVINTK